jgi:hypothetical protein
VLVAVDNVQNEIGDAHRLHRPRDAFGLDRVGRLSETGGVDERHAQSVEIDHLRHQVACRAGHVGDNRAGAPDERVEQARLPHVRSPDDRNLQPFSNQPAAASIHQQRLGSGTQHVNRRRQLAGVDEVITLFGKIHRRFEPRDQVEERRVHVANRVRQRPFELIERRSRLQRGRRIDQVGDRLGLWQVDAAVQKRTQRELSRFGEPCPAGGRCAHDGSQHHRASMHADLHDIVARVRFRSWKIRDEGMVDRGAVVGPAKAGRHN